MGHAPARQRLSADEFLAWETTQAVRYEFVQGEVFDMAWGEMLPCSYTRIQPVKQPIWI